MTAPEWRDCADPDELAAAVAAGVEVRAMGRAGDFPTANQTADQFAGSLRAGITYQLPASWSWRPEPPATGAERYLAGRMADPEYRAAYEATSPPDGCEAVFLPTDVVDHYVSAEPPAGRWERQASFVVNACREAQARRGTLPAPDDPWSKEALSLQPTPPWPGAVLSGLVDEDGVPTWLAQAGQVRGEQVRACTSVPWLPNTSYGEDEWVEVRAPRAVPAAPVTVTIPAETAHALLRYIEDGDYDTDYVIDRLADLLIAAMDGDQ